MAAARADLEFMTPLAEAAKAAGKGYFNKEEEASKAAAKAKKEAEKAAVKGTKAAGKKKSAAKAVKSTKLKK